MTAMFLSSTLKILFLQNLILIGMKDGNVNILPLDDGVILRL